MLMNGFSKFYSCIIHGNELCQISSGAPLLMFICVKSLTAWVLSVKRGEYSQLCVEFVDDFYWISHVLYILFLFCIFYCCSVYSVFIVPTGILQLLWLRFFRAFSWVVRQMPGYTSQRQGTVCTLPNWWIVLFYVLFVCKCVLYYCHQVSIPNCS